MVATASEGALSGLRVIDMTLMLAGPYASMLLADQGAEVIKIEPLHGDYVRTVGPYRPDDKLHAFGGYFQSVNRNKLSVGLDLKKPEGRDILIDLVRGSDVLVENYRAGVMDRLGLSYEVLREANPRLVYGAVRGFGDPRTGRSPYVNWPAYDVIAQAMGGIMGITGATAAQPVKCAVGVLAAVYRAKQTGQGQFVDVSMVDSVLSLCERIVYQHSYEHEVPRPEGHRHPFLTPFGIIPCKDGHLTLACHTDAFWGRLCELMCKPEMASDPRLATEEARRRHQDLVYDTIADFTLSRSKHELSSLFGGQVPFAPVYTVADIVQDPHFIARDMIVKLEHPGCEGEFAVAGVPIKMTETPGAIRRRAPMLSEHAAEVLAGIGIGDERLRDLRSRGVVK